MNRILMETTLFGLEELLSFFRVNFNEWGRGDTKTTVLLLNELGSGESFLRTDHKNDMPRLSRVLQIVKMIIKDRGGRILLENHQILPNGHKKNRQQSPSGKIRVAETPEQAVIREMDEELQLNPSDYSFVINAPHEEERPSKSYPSLRSIYKIYPAHITLANHIEIKDGHEVIDEKDGKKLIFRWSDSKQSKTPNPG